MLDGEEHTGRGAVVAVVDEDRAPLQQVAVAFQGQVDDGVEQRVAQGRRRPLVVCPRKDFTLASRGRRLAETPYFQGDSGRERYRATEVELQTCSSDTPLESQSLP